MRRIKEIDRDHNGYVTSTELDDILRLAYGEPLRGKSLKLLFKPYESI
jgi:Ca2+-binding EF-hand superfamily protein